jgi:hypothetical protein
MAVAPFVVACALTVSTPSRASHQRHHHHTPKPHAFLASELFSRRERRRIAAFMRMRLLEMREAGLERAAAVVERRLRPDALAPHPDAPMTP